MIEKNHAMELVIATPGLLKAVVSEAIQELLPQLSKQLAAQAMQQKEMLSIDVVVAYMGTKGYITSKASLYIRAQRKQIPFRKVNGKLIFERKIVDQWIKNQLASSQPATP
jgi:hypothetical protein